MTIGDGWTSRLLVGLAEHLAANSIGVWRPAGAYTAAETGILIRAVPAAPDRIITLATYPLSSTPAVQDVLTGVQVRMRGTTDPRVVDDLADSVFDLLDSSGSQTWGAGDGEVSIVDVTRQSAVSLGQDGNGRWEASHNYYVTAMRRTTNRTN